MICCYSTKWLRQARVIWESEYFRAPKNYPRRCITRMSSVCMNRWLGRPPILSQLSRHIQNRCSWSNNIKCLMKRAQTSFRDRRYSQPNWWSLLNGNNVSDRWWPPTNHLNMHNTSPDAFFLVCLNAERIGKDSEKRFVVQNRKNMFICGS